MVCIARGEDHLVVEGTGSGPRPVAAAAADRASGH